MQLYVCTVALVALWQHIVALPSRSGNGCVSGRIYLNDSSRIAALDYEGQTKDPSQFDMTIDYNSNNIKIGPFGAELSLIKQTASPATGTRLSTTRKLLYGRISAKFKGIVSPSVITTMITMSDVKDEIDFEMVGAFPRRIEANVFYRGITEYGIHSKKLDIKNGEIDQWHIYTIDWRHDRVTWLIDGQPMHTVWKWNSTSTKIPPSERWFPTTPSKVQISVWEAPISDWSGGKAVDWRGGNVLTAKYGYIDVICYDQNDNPVRFGP